MLGKWGSEFGATDLGLNSALLLGGGEVSHPGPLGPLASASFRQQRWCEASMPVALRPGSPEAGMCAAPTPPAGRPGSPRSLARAQRSARGTPAAGCPASAPSWASWRPWRPVAPSPSWATAFTSTGSGVATPPSSAVCGRVSAPAAGARRGRGAAATEGSARRTPESG